ncbi:MAG: hypothetical protein JWN63_1271 [Candidatus Acidoferrum typicum]|nr:hypothetical protein [Candidatus Acidoferrum typicum]
MEEAWGALNNALGHVAFIVSAYQEFPDLNRMEEERFQDFVSNCRFDEADMRELQASSDRNKFYQDRIFWYHLRDAQRASRRFHRAVGRNSIFIEPEIRSRLIKIDGLMWRALISRRVGHEANNHKLWMEAADRLSTEIEPLKNEIEALVQKRLGYDVPAS